MITLINTTGTQQSQESVLFQLVMKAYPMHHSWIITAHVSLGNLEKQWKMFLRHMDKTHTIIELYTTKAFSPNSSDFNTARRTYQSR